MPDISNFLKQHHREQDGYHIFVVQGGDGTVNVEIGMGPATLKLRTTKNAQTEDVSYTTYLKIPFLDEVKLGEATGSLDDGLTINYNVAVAQGSTSLYLKDDDWVGLRFTTKLLGTNYKGDLKLFPVKAYDSRMFGG